jgi:hypothetical protein
LFSLNAKSATNKTNLPDGTSHNFKAIKQQRQQIQRTEKTPWQIKNGIKIQCAIQAYEPKQNTYQHIK